MDHPTLTPGLTGSATMTVTEADTAVVLGSGDMPVLGTPRVVALAEEAACAAIAGHLPEGRTTVGVRIALDHTRPNAIGDEVEAHAELLGEADGQLVFTITVRSGDKAVATATHKRVEVDRERFLGRLAGS